MRTNNYCKIVALLTGLAVVLAACTTDLSGPKPDNPKGDISQDLKDFGFNSRKEIQLSVNYAAKGFKTLVEVYAQNPVDLNGKLKAGVLPVYRAYTDDNGKLEAKMYITPVKEAWLYTSTWGLPRCVKLEVAGTSATYNAASSVKSDTRSSMSRAGFTFKTVDDYLKLYSICEYSTNGLPTTPGYLTKVDTFGDAHHSVSSLSSRLTSYLSGVVEKEGSCKSLLRDPKIANINTTEDDTELRVVFLSEAAQYENTFGYYYYPTGDESKIGFGTTSVDFTKQKKYVVFPNASEEDYRLGCRQSALLKFVDSQGVVHESFPKGYTVGWFLIGDGFGKGFITTDLEDRYASIARNIFFSNDPKQYQRFITLDDKATGAVAIALEDGKGQNSDYDMQDMIFFVTSNKSINGDRPEVPDEKPEVPNGTDRVSGTFAFEDVWPYGGDYDLNDVAVEYNRIVEFDKNNYATKAIETFKLVNDKYSAEFENYFAYQMEHPGTVIASEGVRLEASTKSVILDKIVKLNTGYEFTIERKFVAGSVMKDIILKDINPYIIVGSQAQDRKEVHLPTFRPTSMAKVDFIGSGDDAYYMSKTGLYPFAIDIPVTNFILSPEFKPIGDTYPKFKSWAESFGENDKEWWK